MSLVWRSALKELVAEPRNVDRSIGVPITTEGVSVSMVDVASMEQSGRGIFDVVEDFS